MKKYFYGIKQIEFIWNGAWGAPTLIYRGQEISYFHLEDAMYNAYCEDGYEGTEKSFEEYMLENIEEVLDIADYLLENKIA